LAEFEPALGRRPEKNIPVYVATQKSILETLVGFDLFQGVLAVGKIPARPSLESILAGSPRPYLLAAVDSLTSAENMGVLVRNCVAFGVQALLVGETCANPFLRRAVRNSMGAIFHLPIVECTGLAQTLRQLGTLGVRTFAAHPHTNQRVLPQADLARDCCVVFGSEGHGLSADVLTACDDAVVIPMPPTVDSLNVSVAAAVFLYEARRQRGKI
jgi:tRNA G18 (ribose-2'-O)-methylase SpoU